MISKSILKARNYFSIYWLKGAGIEIGAGDVPLAIDTTLASVKYVDYRSETDLADLFNKQSWGKVDIIDDAEKLSHFSDNSLCFIAHSHLLEHTINPIQTIELHLNKLRKDGLLFMIIPDFRFSFDKERQLTHLDHLLFDYKYGGACTKKEHYYDYIQNVMKVSEDRLQIEYEKLKERDLRIHFHCFEQSQFLDLINILKKKFKNFYVELFTRNITELICILRKD